MWPIDSSSKLGRDGDSVSALDLLSMLLNARDEDGAGPRACTGNHFAMMEGQLVLAHLAHRVKFELMPGQEVVPHAVFAIRMKNGCRVVVRRRD